MQSHSPMESSHMMFKPVIALAALALASGASAATVLFSEDFDSITSNTLQITTTAASMTVIGNVDAVVPTNPYGITGLTSTVIDLDGTRGPGAVSKGGFNLVAGNTYTLSFVAGGAQRRSVEDSLYVDFISDAPADLRMLSSTGLFSFVGGGFDMFSYFTAINNGVAGTTPFTASSMTFRANNSTSFAFNIGTTSSDNIGPLLDSVMLTQNAGVVPEPATWAMLIAGFGLVGATMRRRRAVAA
jgi:hypothetical protein